MKAILTLLKENIRYKKGAFRSIIALMAIITLSFSVTLSDNDNISRELNSALEKADTADFVSIISEKRLDEKIISALEADENVERSRIDDGLNLNVSAYVDGKELTPCCRFLAKENGKYSFFNESGSGFLENEPEIKYGEVYVPYSLTVLCDCKIGSEFKFRTNGGEKILAVKGFYQEPLLGASVIGTKLILISDEQFKELWEENAGTENEAMQILARVKAVSVYGTGSLSVTELKKEINEKCGLISDSFISISKIDSIGFTNIMTDVGTNVLYVFVALLLTVVLITMNNSISSAVETEYVNLGILKAMGFTKGDIRVVYIIQYTAACVIGTVVGLIASIPLTMVLGGLFVPITGILTDGSISLLKCSAISLAILLVCVLFAFAATRKIGRISPVRAVSGGTEDVHFDSLLNVRVRKNPLAFFIALRNLTSRLKNYIGACVITSILVFFMMSIIMLTQGLNSEAIFGANCDIQIVFGKNVSAEEMQPLRDEILSIDENADVFFSNYRYINADNVEFACEVYDEPDKIIKTTDGRIPKYDNEIAVTKIFAEEMNKKIGDTVTLSQGDHSAEFIITGFYQSANELGRIMCMNFEGGSILGLSPLNAAVRASDEPYVTEIFDMLNERHGEEYGEITLVDKGSGLSDLIDILLNTMIWAIFGVSIVFAAVVVSMLCAKAFARERTDIGILKSVGFTSRVLRLQFALRFTLVSAVGSAIGVIVSIFATRPMLSALMKTIGLVDFLTDFTPQAIILPAFAVCLSFFVFAYIAARKIKTVEVRELISE